MLTRLRLPYAPVTAIALLMAGCGEKADPLALTADPPIVVVWADRGYAHAVGAGDLYVVQGNGTAPRAVRRWQHELDDGQAYGAFNALWSRDRRSIAFSMGVYYADPGSRVAVMSSDGRGLRELTTGWGRMLASWSADGKRLIHTNFWLSADHDLRSVLPSGGPSSPLAIPIARNRRVTDFDWSHDGRRIAAALSDRGLLTMNAQGKNVVRVTRGDDSNPRWSPDGRTLLFTRSTNEFNADWVKSDVYTVSADGNDTRALTDDESSSAIGWSPDGAKILFVRRAVDEDKPKQDWWELWAMNADGGQQTRLPFNRPGWSVISADWGESR